MYERGPSLPSWESLREPSEASIDDEEDEDDQDEDQEDQIRATPAPGSINATARSSGTASHATTASSSLTTITMPPPVLPRLADGIRPPQKRKESEGRIDDPAVKRAKRDPISTNRRPTLGGFQSGTLGGSNAATNKTGAGSNRSGTSKISKPAMPPPSMPPRGIQSQSSSSSSPAPAAKPQTRKPPSGDFRMEDIPSSLDPTLFASAAEKKKKADAVRIATAGSSNSAPAASTSTTSTVKLVTTKPQLKLHSSPSKSQTPAEFIEFTSSDSDPDLPALPPSARLKRQQEKAKGKEKAKEVESISVLPAGQRSSFSASTSTSAASPVRTGKTAQERVDRKPWSKPKPRPKHVIPPGAVVIEVTDSSDDDKQKKAAPSTTAMTSQKSRKVVESSSKSAAIDARRKEDDRMDLDPPPTPKVTAVATVPAVGKTCQSVARDELPARPTEILKFIPSPSNPVAAAQTPLNPGAQTASVTTDAGFISATKVSAPLRFTPPLPVVPMKASKPTSLQTVNPTSSTSANLPIDTRSQPSLPSASSSNTSTPANPPTSSPVNPKANRKPNLTRDNKSSIPSATSTTMSPTSSPAPPATAKALSPPRKHLHGLALKTTGMSKPYKPKLPVRKSVTPTSTDAYEPHGSKSPESSNGSASRSASSSQIDMRDLNTALGLPTLTSRRKSSGGNCKEKEKPSMKDQIASPATPKLAVKHVPRKSSGSQQTLQKFVAKSPKKSPSLSGTGTSIETAIDLTLDVDDVSLDTSSNAHKHRGTVIPSAFGTDEPTARPPPRLTMSPPIMSASLVNSSSPPPDSALEDSPAKLTPVLPEAGPSVLKNARMQSAPTLGEASKANNATEVAKTSMSAVTSLAHPDVTHSQSFPTTPSLGGVMDPNKPSGLAATSGNATLVAGTPITTITTQVQDLEMKEPEAPQPRRSLSGVEADEVEQALVEDLDSISMEEVGMSMDSDADDLPDSQATVGPLRTRRRQITSPGSEDLSTASGPSTSTRSSRRSSRLSKISSGTGSPLSDGHLFEHNDAAQKSPDSSRETSPEASTGLFRTATLGGFPAFQFATYRRNPKSYPKVYHSSDLQTSLHDQMNSLRGPIAAHPDLRDVYEATILQNTADDEPNAPPIVIRNDIDDEPTPPWNFYYTNKMWHGEGVPDPDIENLKGCECKGKCNPKSKKCACAVKNQQVHERTNGYDTNGMLLSEGPVFECNIMCGCDEDCYNRVVQQGRKYDIAIQKTLSKGWGIFNGKTHIPKYRFIGIYSGEILTDKEAHKRGLYYNAAGITYLFDIDFYWVKQRRRSHESVHVVDAFHAGNFTRFLNHSCDPNCRLYPIFTNEGSDQKPLLAVFSIKDILPHEEICFNYQGNYPGDEDEEEKPVTEKAKQTNNVDEIYKKCQCGAANCTGENIFN